MNLINNHIGSKIREIRLSLGETMEAFGSRFNTSKGTINNWEKGRNIPNKENLLKIAELGDISVNDLLVHKWTEYEIKEFILNYLDDFPFTDFEKRILSSMLNELVIFFYKRITKDMFLTQNAKIYMSDRLENISDYVQGIDLISVFDEINSGRNYNINEDIELFLSLPNIKKTIENFSQNSIFENKVENYRNNLRKKYKEEKIVFSEKAFDLVYQAWKEAKYLDLDEYTVRLLHNCNNNLDDKVYDFQSLKNYFERTSVDFKGLAEDATYLPKEVRESIFLTGQQFEKYLFEMNQHSN